MDELIHAREKSAKFREEIRKLKAKLEEEKQNHKKTLQELEKLKSRDDKKNDTKEIKITAGGSQKKETTTESHGEKEQDKRKQEKKESDSPRGENQILQKEIKEAKNSNREISGGYQLKNETLQRDVEGGPRRKERGNLQLSSRKLKPAKEKQEIGPVQREFTELENKVTKQTSEKILAFEKKKKEKKRRKKKKNTHVFCCFDASEIETLS